MRHALAELKPVGESDRVIELRRPDHVAKEAGRARLKALELHGEDVGRGVEREALVGTSGLVALAALIEVLLVELLRRRVPGQTFCERLTVRDL